MIVSAADATIASFRALHPRSSLANLVRVSCNRAPETRATSRFHTSSHQCVAPNALAAEAPIQFVSPSAPPEYQRSLRERSHLAPRNAVGVQLLAPYLHSQLFPPHSSSAPLQSDPLAVSLSLAHLSAHGLSPSQASILNPTHMTLPPLQGSNLDEHFWSLGRDVAQPWLGFAHDLAALTIPDAPNGAGLPDTMPAASSEGIPPADWLALPSAVRKELHPHAPKWVLRSGWTRYALRGSQDEGSVRDVALCEGEPVEYPSVDEVALVFDVETMVNAGPYPVMATAVSSRAWYAWISPWLLGESESMEHLIPFGNQPSGNSPPPPRLIVGHNVSYDRARVLDEYHLSRSSIRWLDTMSLHVATRGISSPQRPAWAKHSKARATKKAQKLLEKEELEEGTLRAIKAALDGLDYDEAALEGLDLEALGINVDIERHSAKAAARRNAADDIAVPDVEDLDPEAASVLWQDVTSANSLAEVAELHCGLRLPKELRNIFVEAKDRSEITDRLPELMSYCARDTAVTHAVFRSVFPSFVKACPHPATLAGVLGLGSAILPVDDEWNEYWTRSERKYEAARLEVRKSLVDIAERLRREATQGITWAQAAQAAQRVAAAPSDPDTTDPMMPWDDDPWNKQLDWTPKKPKRLRGAAAAAAAAVACEPVQKEAAESPTTRRVPKWYQQYFLKAAKKVAHPVGPRSGIAPLLLQLYWEGQKLVRDDDGTWSTSAMEISGSPLRKAFVTSSDAVSKLSCDPSAPPEAMTALQAMKEGASDSILRELLTSAAEALLQQRGPNFWEAEPDQSEDGLDWSPVDLSKDSKSDTSVEKSSKGEKATEYNGDWWPKWYWDLYDSSTAELQLTIRTRIAPLLLKVEWRGCPLFYSREFGWTYRSLRDPGSTSPIQKSSGKISKRSSILNFQHSADALLRIESDSGRHAFYKVPHPSGDSANVGSPFSKSFLSFFETGVLASEHPDEAGKAAARAALDMNAQCSYWIGVRDRVKGQMVVYDGSAGAAMGFAEGASGARDTEEDKARRKGIILPQVVTMGTVTRRAIEKTWLTAANAKKNRLGSELKTMVKAPPGWRIIGADVDSEELWICSVMGDAQFGFHGATAVGWMTLEGTKAQGTDLHSKTAAILGTSRNAAKVFNYSRIYGAGINHAKQLLLKADPSMSEEEAKRRAKHLYAATKGITTPNSEAFGRRFWYGGSESFVFNKLEAVATSDKPTTPALNCGVTAALSRKYLPKKLWEDGQRSEDYMPSRINWVVQSSGVDYLHLLVVAMDFLCQRYNIDSRFMLSVHDEVRYLTREEDSLRAALALQIANLWTRAMFAHKLEMDNLPEGVAWFAAVDLDRVLRKEVDDPCITPSSPDPIPSGEALEIADILQRTNGGSLHADGRPMDEWDSTHLVSLLENDALASASTEPRDPLFPPYQKAAHSHRSRGAHGLYFLQAQAASDIHEVRALNRRAMSSDRLAQADALEMGARHEQARSKLSMAEVRDSSTFSPVNIRGIAKKRSTAARAYGTAVRSPNAYRSFSSINQAHLSQSTSPSSNGLFLSEQTRKILALLPTKPPRHNSQPLRSPEHRLTVMSNLWIPLLRATRRMDRDDKLFWRSEVRGEMRRTRSSCSQNQVEALLQKGKHLLERLLKAVNGDENAQLKLARTMHWLKEKRRRADTVLQLSRNKDPPRSYPSGGLLRPTLFNVPCPRYKPVQPVKLSMMIYHRRRRREARLARRLNTKELLNDIYMESRFERSLLGTTAGIFTGDEDTWRAPLMGVLSSISQCYERDAARAEMVFDRKTLLQAKEARRRRHRIRVANAALRREAAVSTAVSQGKN